MSRISDSNSFSPFRLAFQRFSQQLDDLRRSAGVLQSVLEDSEHLTLNDSLRLECLESEAHKLREQLGTSDRLNQERLIAIEHLQTELQASRAHAAQLRQSEHSQQELWKLWLMQEQQTLLQQREEFNAELQKFSEDQQELQRFRDSHLHSLINPPSSTPSHDPATIEQILTLEEENKALHDSLQKCQHYTQEQEGRLESLEQLLANLHGQLVQEHEAVSSLHKQYDERLSEIQILSSKLDDAQKQCQILMLQLRRAEAELILQEASHTSSALDIEPPVQHSLSSLNQPILDSDNDTINALRQRLLSTQ